jgi:hypothetical protein
VEVSDYPRQLELVRLFGDGIDRVVIETGGDALLAEVRYRRHRRDNETNQSSS